MTAPQERPVWVFDSFQPGQPLGSLAITLDKERLENWQAIYGAPLPAGRVPSGLLVSAMMEAYVRAIRPRPPGNVQAGQSLKFGKPVRAGDRIDAEVSCLWKERRKGRGWVGFGVTLRCDGRVVLSGEVKSIWAE
jgi:acyl dehydratase